MCCSDTVRIHCSAIKPESSVPLRYFIYLIFRRFNSSKSLTTTLRCCFTENASIPSISTFMTLLTERVCVAFMAVRAALRTAGSLERSQGLRSSSSSGVRLAFSSFIIFTGRIPWVVMMEEKRAAITSRELDEKLPREC